MDVHNFRIQMYMMMFSGGALKPLPSQNISLPPPAISDNSLMKVCRLHTHHFRFCANVFCLAFRWFF